MKLSINVAIISSILSVAMAAEDPPSSSLSLRGSRLLDNNEDGEITDEEEFGIRSVNSKYPAGGNNLDMLLQSYGIDRGPGGGPFKSVLDCVDGEPEPGKPCFDNSSIPGGGSNHYDATITSSQEQSNFLRIVGKAEGGSIGLKVSASAEYVQDRSDSRTSVSHMIGGYRETSQKRVNDFSLLQLDDFAAERLKTNPIGFLESYGNFYIRSVTYGGSFIGSYRMTATSSSDQEELAVEASIKYKNGLFSASGSAEYENRSDISNSNLNRRGDYSSKPDSELSPINTPYDLTEAYKKWNDAVEENPAPLYVYLGRWWDSRDVRNILEDPSNGFDQNTINMFSQDLSVDERTKDQASDEKLSTQMMLNSLQSIIDWKAVSDDADLKEEAQQLRNDANQYEGACSNRMNDNQLYVMMNERIDGTADPSDINNNFGTWYYYRNELSVRFDDLMAKIPEEDLPPKKLFTLWRNDQSTNGAGAHCGDCNNNPFRDLVEIEGMDLNPPRQFSSYFTFYAHDVPVPGTTEFVIYRRQDEALSHVIMQPEKFETSGMEADGFREYGKFWAYNKGTDAPDGYREVDLFLSKKDPSRNMQLLFTEHKLFNYDDTIYVSTATLSTTVNRCF